MCTIIYLLGYIKIIIYTCCKDIYVYCKNILYKDRVGNRAMVLYFYIRAAAGIRPQNRKFVIGGWGGGNCTLKAYRRYGFVEKKSVCRVRFVPLTRRSLVQASNSRRERSSLFLSLVVYWVLYTSILGGFIQIGETDT